MNKASKDTHMRVEKPSRSPYRPDIHPVLASYFAEQGLTDAEISSKLHISRQTFYSWRKVHPELEEALRASQERANAMVEAALFKKALSGDVTAQIFFLCNRSSSRWSRNGQLDVQITGAVGKDDLSLEEVVRRYGEAGREAANVGFTHGVQEALEEGEG